jgi:tetratricopeptide (TPR) repeat protein
MSSDAESNPRRQKAEVMFKYGNDAVLKNNYAYAIDMYQNCCKLVPEELKYRMALRGVERRTFGNDPSKVGRLVGAKNQPIRLRAKAAMASKNWSQAILTCEEAFVHNPWDVAAAQIAAEAATNLHIPAVAMWFIESVFAQAGDDDGFLRQAAHVFEVNESWQNAINCWERIKKNKPHDEAARSKINSLSANATITKSGLKQSIHRAESQKEDEGPSQAELEAEELKRNALTPEQRWQKEIEADPSDVRAYIDWADSLRSRGNLVDAEKVLARGVKANPKEPTLLHAHAEVQMARLKHAISVYTQKVKENARDVEAKAKLQQLSDMLRDYELKEFRRRVALHPDDAELRVQLGTKLQQVGQHNDAIAEFQQARNDPRMKVQALMALAVSFEANGVMKLAERSLLDALKAADPEETATLNALHYRLGRIYETLGETKKAEDHYNEVANNDYTYEDVAQRLMELAKGEG